MSIKCKNYHNITHVYVGTFNLSSSKNLIAKLTGTKFYKKVEKEIEVNAHSYERL